jgi:hypothetical protein
LHRNIVGQRVGKTYFFDVDTGSDHFKHAGFYARRDAFAEDRSGVKRAPVEQRCGLERVFSDEPFDGLRQEDGGPKKAVDDMTQLRVQQM